MGIFMLIGTALCAMACLAETSAQADAGWEAKRAALKNRPRPLILNSDGNEVVYWKTNLPVTVGNFTAQRLQTSRWGTSPRSGSRRTAAARSRPSRTVRGAPASG